MRLVRPTQCLVASHGTGEGRGDIRRQRLLEGLALAVEPGEPGAPGVDAEGHVHLLPPAELGQEAAPQEPELRGPGRRVLARLVAAERAGGCDQADGPGMPGVLGGSVPLGPQPGLDVGEEGGTAEQAMGPLVEQEFQGGHDAVIDGLGLLGEHGGRDERAAIRHGGDARVQRCLEVLLGVELDDLDLALGPSPADRPRRTSPRMRTGPSPSARPAAGYRRRPGGRSRRSIGPTWPGPSQDTSWIRRPAALAATGSACTPRPPPSSRVPR